MTWFCGSSVDTVDGTLLDLAIQLVTTLLFAQLITGWTHIIISKPRHMFWFRRVPSGYITIFKRTALGYLAVSVAVSSTWLTV